MLGVVLPATACISAAIAAPDVGSAVATADVRVSVEIIIVVDVDLVVATPAAVTPAAAPGGTHGHSDSKRNRHPGGVVAGWRVSNRRIRVNRGTVYNRRVIAGNVDHFWAGLLDDDDRLVLDNLRLDFHLFSGFQISRIFCFCPHALDCIHDVGLLCQKSIAQIRRPLDVICQTLDEIGKRGHGLDTRIPRLLGYGVCKRLVLQIFVFRQPLLELHDLQWICGGC